MSSYKSLQMQREYARRYYRENREYVRGWHAKYRRENRAKLLAGARRSRWKTFERCGHWNGGVGDPARLAYLIYWQLRLMMLREGAL